ncbi:General stress protein 26 [Cruoricaptor ignavus]|uniref:General stress protein 26 n=1 Tax=Cruoricaptor ignavus TaxID=1118202 RepID=A0A1M6EEC2_9FLAO|nr:pyridoxamine 5'-phosphate oxidase family protein [Cruoricaptor ignavus]SHI83826.1 General stress protein 26 [Cruoricaptor ignavus]
MSTQNLLHTDAIKKLKELSEKARFCMFATDLEKLPINARPMTLQECDEEGNLWFISSRESNKNFDIADDNRVQLFFMNSSHQEYLSVFGNAFIYNDKATIEDQWSPMASAWFEDGKDDENVTIIRVQPTETYYWDTKAGRLVSLISYAAAAISGGRTDNSDGVEGQLTI